MKALHRLAALASLLVLTSTAAFAGPALVIEPKSGLVLYAEDADAPWHPASLTKLMTAYLTFEAIREGKLTLEDHVVCSKHALAQPPSKIGVAVGTKMSVDLALKALIVKSANDVAVMLAEKVAGTEKAFVARMNATARRLGMTQTHFFNANGLPHPQQVTTARDLAILARVLLKEFPQHAYLYSTPAVKFGKHRLRSHNGLLRTFDGADGMKTGYICASGYNVVASARRGDRKIVAVVLGERSGAARSRRAASLLEHGFDTYLWKTMFSTTLDQMALDKVAAAATPANLKEIICKRRPVRRKKKRRRHVKKKGPATAKATKKAAAAR